MLTFHILCNVVVVVVLILSIENTNANIAVC